VRFSVRRPPASIVEAAGCDEHGCEHSARGNYTEKIENETASAHPVYEREKSSGDDEGRDAEQRDERRATQALARVSGCGLPFVERPVCELGGEEQPDCERRRDEVERSLVNRELEGVDASGQRDRDRNERRPPEDQRRHEREERDGGRAGPCGLERVVSAREWNGCDRDQARDASHARRYTRASLVERRNVLTSSSTVSRSLSPHVAIPIPSLSSRQRRTSRSSSHSR